MATKITTKTEGLRLAEISNFEEMLSDEYLGNLNIKQTKFIYEKFFMGTDEKIRRERLNLLNISYSLPLLIAEKIADYVGEPINPFKNFQLFPFVFSYIWGGYSVMKCRKVNNEFVIEYGSPDGYILRDDGTEQLITYLVKENASGELDKYAFVQTYYPSRITNELFKLSVKGLSFGGAIEGEAVPLDTLEATKNISEEEDTGMAESPLALAHNTKIRSIKYGDSEFVKVRSLISSIEVQAVNIQDQLLKHLQAKLAIPVSKMPVDKKTGLVDLSKLEVIGMENGDPQPMYLTNTNPLIERSFELIEKMIIQIAAVLSIPIEFLGLKSVGGAESEGTKIIRLSPFIKKIERIRKAFDSAFDKVNRIAKGFGYNFGENQVISWPDIFPKNKQDEVEELSVAVESKLISRKRAIMRYQGIDEKEADAEIEKINAENASVSAEVFAN